jgi:hypothetical protein
MAAPGRISGVNQAPQLAPNFLSAVHFFSANEGWTYPRDLIDNLMLQLRAYSRDFADSFDSTLKKRFAEGPGITSSVEVGSISGSYVEVTGIKITDDLRLSLQDAMALKLLSRRSASGVNAG